MKYLPLLLLILVIYPACKKTSHNNLTPIDSFYIDSNLTYQTQMDSVGVTIGKEYFFQHQSAYDYDSLMFNADSTISEIRCVDSIRSVYTIKPVFSKTYPLTAQYGDPAPQGSYILIVASNHYNYIPISRQGNILGFGGLSIHLN